jgi:hypothetical protein
MFIHFAFNSLAKENKIAEQTQNIIELILKKKRLKPLECPEFIPVYPTPGLSINLGDPQVKSDRLVVMKVRDTSADERITYLPVPVRMLCFIRISFNQLAMSPHSEQYGKFGIVLTNSFLKNKGIHPVDYYTEESVWTNPLIMERNHYTENNLHPERHKEMQDKIVNYSKPATLFFSFLKLTTIEINRTPESLTGKRYTYNRYPEGYDFTKENEYRIIFDKGEDYLCFNEGDLLMVITPDLKSKDGIESFFKLHWSKQPEVRVFPS